jgi:hypothetical protein
MAPRRCLAGELRNGFGESRAVEVLRKRNNIAAFLAAATIPGLFCGVYAEPIGAAANRARAAAVDMAYEAEPASLGLALDRNAAGAFDEAIREAHTRLP